MVKLQTSVLLKISLFWLNCSTVIGQINTTQNKGECQTINDCPVGAIECKKDIMNENVSHCIYPDNLNEIPINDFDTPISGIQSPVNDTTTEFSNVGNTTTNTTETCTKDEDCPSNKCVSGQCQIDLNSSAVNGTILNDTVISHNNTLPLNCTTNEDCPSNNCVSGQCQMSLEHASLNICNQDLPGSICGNKLEGEKCEKDSDCMTSFCDKKSNTCTKKSDRNKKTVPTAAAVIIIASGVCIGSVLVLLLIKKDHDEKARKVREQYMENVQEPMYIIYSEDYDIPTYTY